MTRPLLVTGATGFIGRHLVRRWLEEGRNIVALARNPSMLSDLASPGLDVLAGSLDDLDRVGEAVPPGSVIIHLAAARAAVDRNPDRIERTNISGVEAIARLARGRSASGLINISTAFTLAAGGGLYARTKSQGSEILDRRLDGAVPVVHVLPTIVYGPDHPSHPNRITQYLRRLISSPFEITIGSGEEPRNLVFIDDVVEAIVRVERAPVCSGSWLIAGENRSLLELNAIALSLAGRRRRPRIRVPAAAALAAAAAIDILLRTPRDAGIRARLEMLTSSWCFDGGPTAAELGFVPTSFHEGVARTLAFIGTRR